ncbi:MAG: hypothetical protein A2136_02210 [Chloroflexi bacterium RBG_16_54_11]|nr:MAG: hypothetical protein A2136_02210 [Chloroflexi bacterium RBG_16_54_11]
MFAQNTRKLMAFYLGAILLGIVIGTISAGPVGRLWNGRGHIDVVQAAAAAPIAVSGESNPDETYICTPSYIGVFSTRVHVLCTAPAPGGIYYFGAPTSDSKNANRVLSIMLTAKSLGKTLQIYYDPSGDGSSFGCQVNDCRPIIAIEMTN